MKLSPYFLIEESVNYVTYFKKLVTVGRDKMFNFVV